MSYKKPILIEIYTLLVLEEDSFTDAKFFEFIPRIKEQGFSDVQLFPFGNPNASRASNKGLEINLSIMIPPAVRCWSEDKKHLVQVSKDHVGINVSGEYPGWDGYKSVFAKCFEALRQAIGDVNVKSILMGTIDYMEVPKEGFLLGEYLACGGSKIPSWYSDCRTACDLSLGKGFLQIDGENQQLKVAVRLKEEKVAIRIESHFQKVIGAQPISDVLEQLHAESVTSFESVITDTTRNEVMGGKR